MKPSRDGLDLLVVSSTTTGNTAGQSSPPPTHDSERLTRRPFSDAPAPVVGQPAGELLRRAEEFQFLLNRMENAAQSENPHLNGYSTHRKAVLALVDDLATALRAALAVHPEAPQPVASPYAWELPLWARSEHGRKSWRRDMLRVAEAIESDRLPLDACYSSGIAQALRSLAFAGVGPYHPAASPPPVQQPAAPQADDAAPGCSDCGFRHKLIAAYQRDREAGFKVEYHCAGVGAECGAPLTVANIFRCGDCGQVYCHGCLMKHFAAHAAPQAGAGEPDHEEQTK